MVKDANGMELRVGDIVELAPEIGDNVQFAPFFGQDEVVRLASSTCVEVKAGRRWAKGTINAGKANERTLWDGCTIYHGALLKKV